MQDMGSKRSRPPDGSAAAIRVVDDERPKKPTSRVYTPEYKQRILRQMDELRIKGDRGSQGALLRREGLNWPTVFRWGLARDRVETRALAPKKRGRPMTRNRLAEDNERLQQQNARLQKELRTAEVIIDVQKKLSALLGIEVPANPKKDETP
jgi:transposase